MVNWIYELEWNDDGNLLFYIQKEGEGIALLWLCEYQHSANVYALNYSFLHKWGSKAKEARKELKQFVEGFIVDSEIYNGDCRICYDKKVRKYYEEFCLRQNPYVLLEYLYHMYGIETDGLREIVNAGFPPFVSPILFFSGRMG